MEGNKNKNNCNNISWPMKISNYKKSWNFAMQDKKLKETIEMETKYEFWARKFLNKLQIIEKKIDKKQIIIWEDIG